MTSVMIHSNSHHITMKTSTGITTAVRTTTLKRSRSASQQVEETMMTIPAFDWTFVDDDAADDDDVSVNNSNRYNNSDDAVIDRVIWFHYWRWPLLRPSDTYNYAMADVRDQTGYNYNYDSNTIQIQIQIQIQYKLENEQRLKIRSDIQRVPYKNMLLQ